jgi:hypothetical protein
MPFGFVDESEAPKHQRESTILKTPDWIAITAELDKPFPIGKVGRLTLSPETIAAFHKKGKPTPEIKKIAFRFVQRLRVKYPDLKIQQIGSEIIVRNKAKAKSAKS